MDDKTLKSIISNLDNLFSDSIELNKENLFESIEVLVDILYSVDNSIFIFDSTSDILWVNSRCYKMLGYKPEEFKKRGIPFLNSLFYIEDIYITEKWKMLLKKDKEFITSARLNHKNGNQIWVNVDAKIFKKRYDGKSFLYITVLTDISKLFIKNDASNILRQGNKEININILDCKLSLREKEILKLVVDGFAGKEIADNLNISFNTVRTHRSNIMKKLNINCIAGLINYYREHVSNEQ